MIELQPMACPQRNEKALPEMSTFPESTLLAEDTGDVPAAGSHRSPSRPAASARLRWPGRLFLGACHGTVLVALGGLLTWWLAVKPILRLVNADRELALVRMVAADWVEVRAPVEGEFLGRSLPVGARVRAGEVLGTVRSSRLDLDIEAKNRMLEALQKRQLLLGEARSPVDETDRRAELEKESRDIALRILETGNELRRLHALRKDQLIRSPVDGQVHYGMTGTRAVRAHDTLAHIWPEAGELLLEVEAPLRVINDVLRKDQVEASFATADGNLLVRARPLPGSLRSFTPVDRPRGQDIWGLLQCVPVEVPEAVRYPGPLGRLP